MICGAQIGASSLKRITVKRLTLEQRTAFDGGPNPDNKDAVLRFTAVLRNDHKLDLDHDSVVNLLRKVRKAGVRRRKKRHKRTKFPFLRNPR